MIVVQTYGGLGNQMFQYALGRHLSLRTGESLRLEIGRRNPSHLGKFDLDRFHIEAEVVGRLESLLIWRPLDRLVEPALARIGVSAKTRWAHRVYRQRTLLFDPEVLALNGPVYLVGWWQCERYFFAIAEVLRRELTVRGAPDRENARLLGSIEETASACVHVRRQDYVQNPATAAVHGACDVDYYRSARKAVETRVSNPHYFIFSDDPAWAREHFASWGNVTIVDQNSPEQRHEDFRLMTACKHFIIANSSFSWWPAWLSSSENKVVVAPLRWFVDSRFVADDIVPSAWIRV